MQRMDMSQSPTLTLINGYILANPDSPVVVPHGKTTVSRGRLLEVNVDVDDGPLNEPVIDLAGCLLMPGLVNAHTHAAMSLFRGLADDLPLDRWLNDYIFPSEARHANEEFVYLGTMLSAVEMALGGITTFADGYFFMEQSAAAASKVGLRGVIAQGILDVPTPDTPVPGSWRDRTAAFLEQCPRDPLIKPALFCHSPYLCGPETLKAGLELARKNDTILFSHVSETAREVQEIGSRYGFSPVEFLNHLGILGRGFVAVHGVHLSEREMHLLAKSGTAVVHCPESNMKLASGAAPVMDLLHRGVTVALGTDGPAGNNNLDLFEEMRSASFMAKLVTRDPLALDARTMLRMATTEGARALCMEDRIGSLETGKAADLIAVDMDRFHLTPVYDPISHLVYSARASDVQAVMVDGRFVVWNGRITTVDTDEVKNRTRESARKIARDLGRSTFL
jgi:5-methylthioadenosine/S-adenosylhomocysteine deaminase